MMAAQQQTTRPFSLKTKLQWKVFLNMNHELRVIDV